MSGDLVLASIELESEPYVKFADDESALVLWRCLEIRGELLAEQLKLRYGDSAWHHSYNDGDSVVIECCYACTYIAPDYRGSYADRTFALYREMSNWEAANRYLPKGTWATTVNSATGDKVLMEGKQIGLAWQPVAPNRKEV